MDKNIIAAADQAVADHLRIVSSEALTEAKLRELARYHDTYGIGQSLSEGTVLAFSKQLDESGVRYSYAAIQAGGRWYLTGRTSPQAMTWDEFVKWLVAGYMVKVTELAELRVGHDD